MLARQDLANRQPRFVHESQRLDQQEIQASVSTLDDRRCVARPTLTGPASSVGQSIEHHPADVVSRLLVLDAGIPSPTTIFTAAPAWAAALLRDTQN